MFSGVWVICSVGVFDCCVYGFVLVGGGGSLVDCSCWWFSCDCITWFSCAGLGFVLVGAGLWFSCVFWVVWVIFLWEVWVCEFCGCGGVCGLAGAGLVIACAGGFLVGLV